MDGDLAIIEEEWIVVVNNNKYFLNKKQATLLQNAIDSGSRGNIAFDNFYINIPFMEEFYLNRTYKKGDSKIMFNDDGTFTKIDI